jgi:hypothetical protein
MPIEAVPERTTRPPRFLAGQSRWLIVRDGGGPVEPICVYGGGERMLPIFSFEEEAQLFIRLGGYDDGHWRAWESCAGELISVLYGPCAEVKSVALDLLPEMLSDGTFALVGVEALPGAHTGEGEANFPVMGKSMGESHPEASSPLLKSPKSGLL